MFAKRLSVLGKVILFFMIALILFSVVACSARGNSATPTIQPTIALALTPTIIPYTPTPLIQMSINKTCWEKVPLQKSNHQLKGNLLYFDPDQNKTILLDLNSYLEEETKLWGEVSPDGKVIVNFPTDNTLRFITQNTDITYDVPADNLYLDTFLVDGSLRLGVARATETNYKNDIGTTDQFYVFNPSTGTFTFHEVSLPYFFAVGESSSFIKYSPDLRYVIYPAWYQEKIVGILFDIEKKIIVWAGDTSSISLYPTANWLPDSSAVEILLQQENFVKNEDFFKLSPKGDVVQLTRFDSISHYYLKSPSWSPNGRYLAFRDMRDKDEYLIFIDTKTGIVYDTCLSLGTLIFSSAWAPDSTGFAIMPRGMTAIVVADLINQVVYEVYKQPGVDFVDPYAKPNQILLNFRGWLSWEIP